jgi:hypothetical protein
VVSSQLRDQNVAERKFLSATVSRGLRRVKCAPGERKPGYIQNKVL